MNDVSGGNISETIIQEDILGSVPSIQSVIDTVPAVGFTDNIAVPDVSGGNIIVYSETAAEPIRLWESNIADYSITDGLLLLILCVLIFDAFVKRR